MILDTVLRMEVSIEELRSMVVRNKPTKAISCELMIYTRLWAPVQMSEMASRPIQRLQFQQLPRDLRMHAIIQADALLGTRLKVLCSRLDIFPQRSLF
jgi:hypothetical protein